MTLLDLLDAAVLGVFVIRTLADDDVVAFFASGWAMARAFLIVGLTRGLVGQLLVVAALLTLWACPMLCLYLTCMAGQYVSSEED